MPTSSNVSAGKPRITGGVYVAPAGTTLPADASTALASAFKNLGYASDDGVTNANSATSSDLYAWGGDNVLTPQGAKKDTFKVKLIEAMNDEVLKQVYGASNVTGSLATGLAVTANAKELTAAVWVFDMILKGGVLKRIVIPSGQITQIGEITYKDDAAIGYEITITAAPDGSGNTHYEYIKTPSTPPGG